jgi:hypothetical protein
MRPGRSVASGSNSIIRSEGKSRFSGRGLGASEPLSAQATRNADRQALRRRKAELRYSMDLWRRGGSPAGLETAACPDWNDRGDQGVWAGVNIANDALAMGQGAITGRRPQRAGRDRSQGDGGVGQRGGFRGFLVVVGYPRRPRWNGASDARIASAGGASEKGRIT